MVGSIGEHIGAAIFTVILVVGLTVAAIFGIGGYVIGSSKYKKGYLKGQLDCQAGINKVKRDTTYTLKLQQ